MAKRDKSERGGDVAGMSDSFMSGGVEKTAFKIPDNLRNFKPEKDKMYRLLFVPFKTNKNPAVPDGKLYFERTYYTHPALGPNKETVLCLARNFKKKCPACSEADRIYAKPYAELNMQEKARAKSLKPKQRQMFQVVDLDAKDKGIQFLEISNFCFGKHLSAKVSRYPSDQQAKLKTFFNPAKPMYLQIGVREESVEGGKPFPVLSDIEFKEYEKALPASLLEKAVCLDDLINDNEPKYKRIAGLVNPEGGDDQEDETEEDDLGLDDEDSDLDSDDEDADEEDGDGEEEEADEDSDEAGADDDEDAEDAGEGDDEEDEEEDEEDAPALAPGQSVTFLRKGVRKSGKVVKVKDNGRVLVQLKDGAKEWMDSDDLTPKEAEEKPAKKPQGKTPPGKKPAGKKPKPAPADEDDSDDPF